MSTVAHTLKTLGGVGLNSSFKALIAPMMVFALLSGCKVTKKAAAAQAATADTSTSTPAAPVPAPAPSAGTGTVVSATLAGAAAIGSNFDVSSALQPAWGTGGIPKSAAPDVMGAFRFVCGAGQLKSDDPIMYPGQPGKSHLHQFFGNTAADANSTYSSLRSSGDSTCNWTGNGTAANRSSYWMPAMLDGRGNVVRPDWIFIYYKQVASQDHPACAGKCINIPNGLRFIYGWDPTGVNSAKTGTAYYNCQGPTAVAGHYQDLTNVKSWCPPGNQLGAIITAPSCWDGKNRIVQTIAAMSATPATNGILIDFRNSPKACGTPSDRATIPRYGPSVPTTWFPESQGATLTTLTTSKGGTHPSRVSGGTTV